MWIDEKLMTETEANAYVTELKSQLKDRENEADNGTRQIAAYEDECRRLKDILELARSEVYRPYPDFQYRWELELARFIAEDHSIYRKEGGAENG